MMLLKNKSGLKIVFFPMTIKNYSDKQDRGWQLVQPLFLIYSCDKNKKCPFEIIKKDRLFLNKYGMLEKAWYLIFLVRRWLDENNVALCNATKRAVTS